MNDPSLPVGGAFLHKAGGETSAFAPEELSGEALLVGRTMDEFVRRAVLPVVERLDAQEAGLMASLVREAGSLGLLSGALPEQYGGLGLPKTTLALLAEKSASDLSFAITIGVHAGVATLPIYLFGTDEQRSHYLPKLATGEMIAAFALSEGNSGSDALAANARASLRFQTPFPLGRAREERTGVGTYLLDGTKLWVTNGGFADLLTVFAQAENAGFTAYLVEREASGVSFSGEEKKLGLRGSSTRRLFLADVPVTADQIVGEIGKGHRPALFALNAGRMNIAAISLGGAKEALRIGTEYALARRQSGRPVAEFGLVEHKLSEMAVRIFALESMVYRTAGYWDAFLGCETASPERLALALEEYAIECAILKFMGTETLGYAADEALQIHGGFGYSEEFPAARLYRDARVFRIFEGTNEINRLTVVDQIRRRGASGRLVLTADLAKSDGAIGTIRHIAVYLLDRYLAASGERQQAVGAIADIVGLLYAIDSMTLRCAKLSALAPHNFELASSILEVFLDAACGQTELLARTAFGALGGDTSEYRRLIAPLTDRPIVDTVSHRRVIAAAVRDAGGYPFQ